MTAPARIDSHHHRILALFPELQGVGGIQEAGRLTATALAEIASANGWATDFLSLNDPPGRQTLALPETTVSFRGFGRVKRRFVLSGIASVRRGAQVVIAAHPHLAVPAAISKLFQPKLRIAVISHGVEVWRRLSSFRHRAFLQADIFMAPSRYTIDTIVEIQGAPRQKTRQIAWPLSPHIVRLAEHPEALPRPAEFPDGPIVLTVARLMANEKYKGIDQLIRTVARLARTFPAVQLVIVATGNDVACHRQLAADLAIAPRVHFLEDLSVDDIAACYAHCDIFALPSTGEGFGLVFVEAMAFGKPVVGAAAGGVTDIIEAGVNGLLVAPGDFDQLSQSLERLLQDASLRAELGRRGAESVRANYQFANFRQKIEQVLVDCGLERNSHG